MDRFGNQHAPNLSYARGNILTSTADDFRKLAACLGPHSRARGQLRFHLHGSRAFSADAARGPALCRRRDRPGAPLRPFEDALRLEHLGGSADKHDVAPFNRLTGATMATHLTLVKPGDAVIGVSASHSHPSVVRAANHVGSRFTDTAGLANFKEALTREEKVTLVVLTRLAVTYELLPVEDIEHDRSPLAREGCHRLRR